MKAAARNPATIRARRELYGCTNAGNARRLAQELKSRGPDAGMVRARHLAARLPSLVRAEAQRCRAASVEIDLCNGEGDRDYRTLIRRADTLERWAVQCTYESTQEAALLCLERMMEAGAI